MKGVGRAVFVGVLLLIAGTLNIIYGIGAVSNAHFFAHTQYVFSSLKTWDGSRSSSASSSSLAASRCSGAEATVG